MTLGDIRRILPWEDVIMKVKLTGRQFYEALERSVAEYPTLNGSFFAVKSQKLKRNLSFVNRFLV